MRKIINFHSGPSMLPQETLDETAKAILDFNGIGMSIMEISHRSKEFKVVMDDTMDIFRELLDIPKGYSILFLGGGASLQFSMIPFNFLNKKAAYINTDIWADRAMKEAKMFGETVEIASSADKNYSYIPKDYHIPTDADYLHITSVNSIHGTQFHTDIDSPIPLMADMSSEIFSRPIDISKYGLIYGGAQKNFGSAGLTFVIIKDAILNNIHRQISTMLDYRVHVEHDSMYNTPPVTAIYSALQSLKWVKANGGVYAMQKKNKENASTLYREIDSNPLFHGTAREEDRSIMNVCFAMSTDYQTLEDDFIQFSADRNIIGIKGHRLASGFRASLYNSMPLEGVQALVNCMKDFAKEHVK